MWHGWSFWLQKQRYLLYLQSLQREASSSSSLPNFVTCVPVISKVLSPAQYTFFLDFFPLVLQFPSHSIAPNLIKRVSPLSQSRSQAIGHVTCF